MNVLDFVFANFSILTGSNVEDEDGIEDDDDDYVTMDIQQCVKEIFSNDDRQLSIYDVSPNTQSSIQDVIKLGAGTRKLWSEMPEVNICNLYLYHSVEHFIHCYP